MRVLVGCEESQMVCMAFRERGHEAYSCDIMPCSGGHPEWHIQGDVLAHLGDGWDLLIAHPPCTYLSVVGAKHFVVEKFGEKAVLRARLRDEAIIFFRALWAAPIEEICLENPVGFINNLIKPTQIIHPYYFGEKESKRTCLWLKNLSRLNGSLDIAKDVKRFKPEPMGYNGKGEPYYWSDYLVRLPREMRTKERSKTFPLIAKAMAEQWG